jgi:hypothetical protein
MSELPTKTSITPSADSEAIAFVYQDSLNNPPTYKIVNGRINDCTESIPALIKAIRTMRNKIRFLNKKEISDRFGLEAAFIRPFTENERKQVEAAIKQ